MAHREFRGVDGRQWTAWSVHPEYAERRALSGVTEEQPVTERRVRAEVRAPLAGTFARGWLAFETKGEKRRLTPYPEDWAGRSDEELRELLETATIVPHARRRLVE
jgi:hypothetical protein